MYTEASTIDPTATTTTTDDVDVLRDIRDEHQAVQAVLAPPGGMLPEDYAEHVADVYAAVLEAAGFAVADDATPMSDDDREAIVKHLTADDLLTLVRGLDLPAGHPYLKAVRGTAQA